MTTLSEKKIPIEYFSINGLHGERDITINFKEKIKIFVAENGYGKTTALRIFNNFFSKNHKISEDNFKNITLKKHGTPAYTFHKELTGLLFGDILQSIVRDNSYQEDAFFEYLRVRAKLLAPLDIPFAISILLSYSADETLSEKDIIKSITNDFKDLHFNETYISNYASIIRKIYDEHFDIFFLERNQKKNVRGLYNEINYIYRKEKNNNYDFTPIRKWLIDALDYIEIFQDFELIYLPTYRLIESNIIQFKDDNNIFFDEAKEIFDTHPIINFGTEKIERTWERYSNQIREATTTEFQRLSSKLLMDFVEDNIEIINNKNTKNKIIKSSLSSITKLNDKIYSDSDKEKIRNFIKGEYNEGAFIKNNSAFFYVLNYLSTIHDKQRTTLELLNKYCNAINSFFNNKKVIIDDFSADIYIEKKKSNKRISPESLSSGEKQILSLFTRLFLEKENKEEKSYWIIYDEPELSLSIEWQSILLPQIMSSGKCSFLLCATHSPFIFDNDYAKYASDLSLHSKELENGK
ncbi:TPA: AAA family ATPase [Aeromonas veronii]|nr:AAA family ATPase [Aeromonas veronii]